LNGKNPTPKSPPRTAGAVVAPGLATGEAVKKDVLAFLKRERDALTEELRQLQKGERQVIHLNGGHADITSKHMQTLEARLFRFEEMIAASESGVA
jgi:hypothetical protein